MKTKKILILAGLMVVAVFVLTGCGNKGRVEKFQNPDIKDDFCGPIMSYQYCKCAFHDEYCDVVGLSSAGANTYVREEFNKWVDQKLANFESSCNATGGIYKNKKCTYCEEPYYKEGDRCVKAEEGPEEEEQESDEEMVGFVPDGPFNDDCSINEDLFENEWRKYSDFDNAIDYNQRSWEAQQHLGVYEQILDLKAQNFVLQRDMEIDRQLRLTLRDYKSALVQNIKTNLLKSFWRLSYITYSTIKSGKGVGESYSKVLTSGQTLERVSQGLKVVQAVIPSNSSLAIDTSNASGKVKSIGLNAALEAFDSMGDPLKIATQVVNDSANAALPSADITPEEVEILRTQHLQNKAIDEVLQESYKKNAERRKQLLVNEKEIARLETEAASWQAKEKARVRGMLEADCQRQQDDFENQDTSFLPSFINKANAQEEDSILKMDSVWLGEYQIPYIEVHEEEGVTKYYGPYNQDKVLVLAAYDTDENGQADLWLQYDEDLYVILEAYDTTGDGLSDTFVELDREENMTNLVQPAEEREVEESADNNVDYTYVADIKDQEDGNNTWIAVFIVVVVLAALGIKKYKK